METDQSGTKLKPMVGEYALPGNYPCLTMQVNVTRYQNQAMGKMVLVVREPSVGVELRRAFRDVSDWDAVATATAEIVAEMLGEMRWLQEGYRAS